MGQEPKMAAHCLIVLVLAAAVTTSTGQEAAATGKPASPGAREFLTQRCKKTDFPDTCFDDLLPYAESFSGSRTKVAIAATTILMAKLDSLLAELHGVNINLPGQFKLDECIKVIEGLTSAKKEKLARFKALEVIEDSKHTPKDTAELDKWIDDVDAGCGDKCDEVVKIPKVNEMVPSYKGVTQFTGIADPLVTLLTDPKDNA
ncbi:hypothetical protein ACP70R_003070 [Stipagrostis hirtigluma subsp. patula]